MLTNVFVLGVEVDVVAIFSGSRPTVSVIEVKRRPKRKLVEQLRRRALFSDLVYAAVPYKCIATALRRIPARFGVIAIGEGFIYVARGSEWFGRGRKLLEALELESVYEGRRAEALSSSNNLYAKPSRSIE